MTKEEAKEMLQAKLECLENTTSPKPCDCECIECDLEYRQGNMGEQKQALDIAIKALEQQPSEDKVIITMDKGTLKYSGKGYVVYNKDWFKKHFATEVEIMTGYDGYKEQQPSDDIMAIHTQGLDEGIRCAMCTNSMKSDRGCDGGCVVNEDMYKKVMDTIKKLVALPPVTPAQSWIPVSERLPEEETDVLIYNANKEIAISRGSYSTEIENTFIWYTSGWRFGEVIAWQPLPKPYEEKRGSEDESIT